nr:hypothetical protein [Tanacetum cinerariifolium]
MPCACEKRILFIEASEPSRSAGAMTPPPGHVQWYYPQPLHLHHHTTTNITTRLNGEALRKCILSGPYKPTTVLVQAVEATDDSPPVPEHTTVETPTNMSPENKAHFLAEKEAIHLILTGIGDAIYSTVDACHTAQEIWEEIERLQQGESLNIQDVKTNLFWEFGKFTSHDGESVESYYTSFYKLMNEMIRNNLIEPTMQQYQNEVNELRAEKLARNANPLALVATAQASQDSYYQSSRSHRSQATSSKPSIPTRSNTTTRHKGKEIAKPITPPSETASEEDSDPKQAQKDKDTQKNLALIAKYFKKIYKPTNNNLRTSSNSKNKNVDTTLRYKNDSHSRQFRNQRTVNVAAVRENVGSKVVQQSGIQCYNCREYRHFANECRMPKRVKDSAYHKEKMLLCKQAEQGVPFQAKNYMAKIQEVPTADSGTDSEPVEQVQNDAGYNVFANHLQHSGQSESVSNTCLVETDDSNVIPDSPDMCEDDIQNDQNDVESDDECVALANLIANLKLDVNENKKIQKLIPNGEETLALERESQSKLIKDLVRSYNYTKLNSLYEIFKPPTQEYETQLAHANEIRRKMWQKSFVKSKPNIYKNVGFLPVSKSISKSRQAYNVMTNNINHFKQIVDDAWIKHSKDLFRAPTAHDMEILIQTCLMPLAIKTQSDSLKFVHELKQEMHADLKYVESLEKEIDELESDKAEFSDMYDVILQECVSKDVMCSYLMSLSGLDALDELQCLYLHKVKECNCLAEKISKQTDSVSKKVHNELLQRFAKVEKHSISLEIALQKCKEQAKSVDTKFDRPSVIRQPNAQRILKPSVLAKKAVSNTNVLKPGMYRIDNRTAHTRASQLPQTVRNTNPRVSTSTGVNHKPTVSRLQLKSNQSRDKVLPNNSQVKVKKTQVEVHPRIPSVSNKIKSVTACKDSLNSKTLNANAVCDTCNKCLVDSNHFACVTKILNDVYARTKKPTVVPISTRKPKSQANKSVATPNKKKVASKPINQKPHSYFRVLYENTNKAWKWWIERQSPSGYKWVPKPKKQWIVQLILFIVDSGYTKHMTGNLKLLCNFVEKFLGTVRFGNDQFTLIIGYGDLIQGNATPTQAWLWHQRLSHLKFDYINLLSKKDIMIGLPKLKYVKDQLCSSCELSKAKRSSFKSKAVLSLKGRLNLLHMDLCGPMRVASINGKKYVLVIVDDYSRYTWTLFLHSKDETPKIGTEFLNKTLNAFFKEERIEHQTSTARTPEQNEDADVPSQQELDMLFGYLYDKFFNTGLNPSTNIQSTSTPSTHANMHAEENDNDQAEEREQEAMADSAWIEAMQEELHQFDRLQVWELVDKSIIRLKWLWKNKKDEDQTVIRNKARLVAKGTQVFSNLSNRRENNISQWSLKEEVYVASANLRLQIHQSPRGIFINQAKYTLEILHKHGMDEGQSTDADHARRIDSRKSTSRGIQFLGDKLVSWMLKKQNCTAMSSVEAKYVALSTSYMFTKALPEDRFKYLVRRIGMRCLTPAELEILAKESA